MQVYKKTAFITNIAGEGMATLAEHLRHAGVYVMFLCKSYDTLPNLLSEEFLADETGYYAFAGDDPRNILYLSYIQECLSRKYHHIDYVVIPRAEFKHGGMTENGVRDVIYAITNSADTVYACAHILRKELESAKSACIITQALPYSSPCDIALYAAEAAQTAVVRSLNADYQRRGIAISCCEVMDDADMAAVAEQMILG